MPIILQPKDEQEWLNMRADDVTSTECSALFEMSPYQTKFELWHAKKNKTVLEFEDNDRTKWGRRLQDVIAYGIAEDRELEVRPLTSYARHSTVARMGSSFDFEIIAPKKGILEIKNVDSLIFKKTWIVEGDYVEAPAHIEFQLQHQLEVMDLDFGIIGAFVGGNNPIIIERERDKEVGGMIVGAINQFWHEVDNNIEPKPDFDRDAEILKKIYKNAGGEPKIITDIKIMELCENYKKATEWAGEADALKRNVKSELLTLIGDAPKVFCGDYTISAGTVNRKGYVVNDTSYRDFRITKKKV